MPVLSQPAFGPKTALAYVTSGTLMCVWTSVWYFTRETEMTRTMWFWVAGLFLTGATLVFLGVALGPLGRVARQAELPPGEAIAAEAQIQQTAAANPPAVVAAPVGAAGSIPAAAVHPAVPAAPVGSTPVRTTR